MTPTWPSWRRRSAVTRTAFAVIVQQRPEVIDDLLAEPSAVRRSSSRRPTPSCRVRLTPFLLFGILINRVAVRPPELELRLRVGRRRTDGSPCSTSPRCGSSWPKAARRYLLIEFLASFTKVASGRIWVKTRRGYQSRRYSELDLVRMVDVVMQLPPAQRPGGYQAAGRHRPVPHGGFPRPHRPSSDRSAPSGSGW